MRLLNINSLELHDFTGRKKPPYTILSHRWGDDEVSYKDFRKRTKPQSSGYRKILEFCSVVRSRKTPNTVQSQIEWVWVDTCKSRESAPLGMNDCLKH
jgi:hypothetical protein